MISSDIQKVLSVFSESKIISIFYQADADRAKSFIDACYEGGIRVIEFTNRGDSARKIFPVLVRHCQQYPDLVIGIGTLFSRETTEDYINSGAQFIVSPILNPEMAVQCGRHHKLWIPGCATVNEIMTARNLGAELIKIFPASIFGPYFITAVLSVLPGIRLMPTGGIEPTKESITEWLNAGATCIGIGSGLMYKKNDGDYDTHAIIRKIKELSGFINNQKNNVN